MDIQRILAGCRIQPLVQFRFRFVLADSYAAARECGFQIAAVCSRVPMAISDACQASAQTVLMNNEL